MAIEITRKNFICKECFRQLSGIDEIFFNNVYEGKSLCVTCRKKKGKNLTESERGGLWAETALYI
jgi:hypothetical protein